MTHDDPNAPSRPDRTRRRFRPAPALAGVVAIALAAGACAGERSEGATDPGDASDGEFSDSATDTAAPDTDASDSSLDPVETGDGDDGDPVDGDDGDPVDGDATPSYPDALVAYCDGRHAEVEARIDALLGALTIEQKASLMHGLSLIPTNGTWATTSLPELDVPGFRMLDGPRGLSRFSGKRGTAFPVAMARGATWDPELEREVGRVIASELRLAGADTLLAPTVNVLRHPRWGRAQETYGEDPLHIGVLGSAFVEGAQRHVMACVKHYAANSIENTRLEVDVRLDETTLREIYLPHFEAIVRGAGVASVMTSYNRINGLWGSEQTHLLVDILRGEWGFAGFTVSDFTWGTHDTAAALAAGLDVEMQYAQVYGRPVVEGVGAGQLDEALVDAAVRRILRAQWCWRERLEAPTLAAREGDEAMALARRVATRGAVLLENRGVLPIDRGASPTVAVVGPLATAENTGDRGSSHVNSSEVVTMLEGLVAAAGDASVVHVPGDLSDEAAREQLAAADIVVAVVGYTEGEEGEGQVAAGDRRSLALPDDDRAVLAAATGLSDAVVAVVVGGSAFTTEGWGDEVEALVMAWYAGARGGDAIAALLFGDANFSGRLPLSFARSEADLPPFDNVSLQVDYGYFHGYRLLQHEGSEALYPFGYGLSYTTFGYDGIEVEAGDDALRVRVAVSNTGEVSGIETVQVYVAGPESTPARAPRDLRGFAQLTLEPDESGTATITIPIASLRRWDEGVGWNLHPGTYTVAAGPDADTLPVSAPVTLSP